MIQICGDLSRNPNAIFISAMQIFGVKRLFLDGKHIYFFVVFMIPQYPFGVHSTVPSLSLLSNRVNYNW